MLEELENQVNPGISTLEVETTPEIPAPQIEQEKKDREYNFRAMRDRAIRAEERAAALEREKYSQQPKPQENDQPDDDFATFGHIKKYDKRQNELDEKIEETRKAQAKLDLSIAEMHVRGRNPDYDKVVNDDNLERLYKVKPEMIENLQAIKDAKTQMQLAYDAINMYVQPTKTATQEKKIEENRMKPRSAASISPQASESPLSRADDYDRRTLTEQRKKELYHEMIEAASHRR